MKATGTSSPDWEDRCHNQDVGQLIKEHQEDNIFVAMEVIGEGRYGCRWWATRLYCPRLLSEKQSSNPASKIATVVDWIRSVQHYLM